MKQMESGELKAKNLIKLARAIYELAYNEENKELLQSYEELAGKAKEIFDNAEDFLHPDLGLELHEFIRLKADGIDAGAYFKVVDRILKELENDYYKGTKLS